MGLAGMKNPEIRPLIPALHFRFTKGWGGTAAWFSIVGFASVMFTCYGVNYLLFGLHSCG